MIRNEFVARAGTVLPPLVSPFDADENLDLSALEKNSASLASKGIRGFVCLGSNSEAVHLSYAEKVASISAVRDSVPEDCVVLAGTGVDSVRETVRLTKAAAEAGAELALVITPYFYGKGSSGVPFLRRYYTEVAEAADIPVLIYDVTKYTGVSLTADFVLELLEHPNIVGIKDSSGLLETLSLIEREAPDSIPLVGTASSFLEARKLGIPGGVMALANSHPAELLRLDELGRAGAHLEAEQLQRDLAELNTAVTATFGIAGLKEACRVRGYDAGHVRSPLGPLDPTSASTLVELVHEVDERIGARA
ncbi:dihydrodipicolinate synthase family protein [Ornithinimicrobium sp. Y1847]|uniref:dihydrodipicolinate synthase family protein n=1 Tax=Ornithinimicrobium sp. Y1847 TaxID=3405419 RepID=UPI003B673F86